MRRIVLFVLLAFPFAVLVALLCFPGSGGRPAPEAPKAPASLAPIESLEAPPPPATPRALPITGIVLDPGLEPMPDVEVRVGGEAATAGADGKFLFPTAVRPGRSPVSIRRDGKDLARWDAVVTGDILPDGSDGGETELRPEMVRWTFNLGPEPGAETDPESPKGSIALVAALIEEWGATGHAQILGRTTLPDGAHIDTSLSLDGDRIVASTERAEARGGAFLSRIRFPDHFRIHPGGYDLQLLFAVSLEDFADLERWAAEKPGQEWGETAEVSTTRRIQVGDPVEGRAEDSRIDAYFQETLDSIERLRKTILERARRSRELAAPWDPELIAAQMEVEKSSFGAILDGSGKLDVGAWRRFLDEGWRPEVERLLAGHQARRSAGLSKFRRAENLLESVLKKLLRISQIESMLVYQAWGLPTDRKDFYLDENLPGGDEVVLLQILVKDITLLRQYRNLDGAPPGGDLEDGGERDAGAPEDGQSSR